MSGGFVPGFEEDIFISYGHIDNSPPDAWITKFHERLGALISQALGDDIRIWRDTKLDGADLFWDKLQQKVSRSALFLAVLTPRYARSEACKRELGSFLEAAARSGGLRVGTKSRVIRVIKTPYPKSNEPTDAGETLAFKFFQLDPDHPDNFMEYSAERGLPGYPEFHANTNALAQSIARLLELMVEEHKPSTPPLGKTVYLAEATSEARAAREAIANELRRWHRVLPEGPLPDDGQEMRDTVKAALQESQASVHIIGKYYGKIPEREEKSLPVLQYEIAAEHLTAGSRQIVWVPNDLEAMEPRQQAFLALLREKRNDARTEVMPGGLHDFIASLVDILAAETRRPVKQPKSKSVYLLCDQPDLNQPELKAIRSFFLDEGYPVELPVFQGDPGQLRELEEQIIQDSNATLIYYGQTQDAWVRAKRRSLLGVLGKSGAGKLHTRGLYLCPPKDDIKVGVYGDFAGKEFPDVASLSPLLVLGDFGPFLPEKLAPFLSRLESDAPC